MRSLNYRDFVLWPTAYKLGLDPTTNFEATQAKAIGTYINSWVRRLFTNADWPEWEIIDSFTPIDHFVTREQPPPAPGALSVKRSIGTVLSVHLIDPRTTNDPSDIVFTESEQGVHVGYDHGTNVWIKYLPACPIFTADPWDSNRTFRKGEVTYSPTSGECYISKVNGNRKHDPALDDTFERRPLPPQNTQEFSPPNPGFDASTKIMALQMSTIGDITFTDPPDAAQSFTISVIDAGGGTLATATVTATGESLSAILDELLAILLSDPDLSTFAITNDPDTLTMRFEDASDFIVTGNFSPSGSPSGASYDLVVNQIQAFITQSSAITITPQRTSLTITDTDVRPSATYSVTFTDPTGVEHEATYTASKNDSAAQILSGLIASIHTLGGNDPVLAAIGTALDAPTATATFSSIQELGVSAAVQVMGSLWWDVVPFPFELIDPVVRGANADTLKEWGQTDKGTSEEQSVPIEAANRLAVPSSQQFTQLSERTRTKSRYALR